MSLALAQAALHTSHILNGATTHADLAAIEPQASDGLTDRIVNDRGRPPVALLVRFLIAERGAAASFDGHRVVPHRAIRAIAARNPAIAEALWRDLHGRRFDPLAVDGERRAQGREDPDRSPPARGCGPIRRRRAVGGGPFRFPAHVDPPGGLHRLDVRAREPDAEVAPRGRGRVVSSRMVHILDLGSARAAGRVRSCVPADRHQAGRAHQECPGGLRKVRFHRLVEEV